jgi:hypothetical protein
MWLSSLLSAGWPGSAITVSLFLAFDFDLVVRIGAWSLWDCFVGFNRVSGRSAEPGLLLVIDALSTETETPESLTALWSFLRVDYLRALVTMPFIPLAVV